MKANAKIAARLLELGFDDPDTILSTSYKSPFGISMALAASIDITYCSAPIVKDSIVVAFIVSMPDDIEKAHISMIMANYYLHGKETKECCFSKIYTASTEILPTKDQITYQMKKVMGGRDIYQQLTLLEKKGGFRHGL